MLKTVLYAILRMWSLVTYSNYFAIYVLLTYNGAMYVDSKVCLYLVLFNNDYTGTCLHGIIYAVAGF